MRSLIDPTGGKKPYATVNLLNGGCIHLRPSLITEIIDKKKFCLVKYGQSWIEVKEDAKQLHRLVGLCVAAEKEANR